MAADVFLSYARSASAAPVRALADALQAAGVSVFLDEREIAYGEPIPTSVVDGLLRARVVVVYAEPVYFTRWYCQLEYAATVAGFRRLVEQGAPEAERLAALAHVVIALPSDGVKDPELDALPGPVRQSNWPAAADADGLVTLVHQRLTEIGASLWDRLSAVLDSYGIQTLFTREASLPPPLRLAALPGAPPLPLCVPVGTRQTLHDRFVGRADDLWRLHDVLAPASTITGRAALTGALRGIGGVGKTQLAAEYLYRYGPRHYTGGVFWLDATRDVVAQHHAILQALGEPVPDLPALREQVEGDRIAAVLQERLAAAFRRVCPSRPVLLIVDDVPEPGPGAPPAPFETWCPAPDAVACLATSRTPVHFAGQSALTTLQVDVLAPDDAVAVLTGVGVDHAALADADWARIAAWVGHLPLALTLLHSAMSSEFEPLSPTQVLAGATAGLSTTRELDGALDALRASVPFGALRGISEAFLLSYERLPLEAQTAARLLAEFGPEPIPLALIDALGEPLASPAVRTLLKARAFVMQIHTGPAPTGVPHFGAMHRVVADFLRARREPGRPVSDFAAAVRAAAIAVMTPAKCRDPGAWPLMRACAPHAERLVATGEHDPTHNPEQVVGLALRVGMYLSEQGEMGRARAVQQAAVRVANASLGCDHPTTLTSMGDLAITLGAQGDLATAHALEDYVLAARTRVLGPEHLDTLTAANNLALTLRERGDLAGARALQARVLEARTRLLGAEHPDTLTTANSLATTLDDQGDVAGAGALFECVLEARARLLGPEDPDTLRSANNLASTLDLLGDLSRARALHERVLEMRTRVLGAEHPDTLTSANNLSHTLQSQGDLAGARSLQERVLEARTRRLGAEHPATLRSRANLARTLEAQGDRAGACRLERCVLEARERLLGPEHPDTLTSVHNLAHTLYMQGEIEQARRQLETAYQGRTRILGAAHPDTVASREALQIVLRALGESAAADALDAD